MTIITIFATLAAFWPVLTFLGFALAVGGLLLLARRREMSDEAKAALPPVPLFGTGAGMAVLGAGLIVAGIAVPILRAFS